MEKILIVDEIHKSALELFNKNNINTDYKPNINYNEALNIIQNYNGILIRSKFKIEKEFINKASNLKIIARAGAGLENIDTAYCLKKNIKVVNSPEGNKDAVGEHALGMLLMLFNKINLANNEVKNGIWNREKNWGEELNNKTIGIIGYGNMGQSFAEKLKGFNVEILVYDKYKTNFATNNIKEVKINDIYQNADIISFHVPLTNETKYYLNTKFINNMKKTFYLINTSRGKIVNTNDLLNALKTNKISGACLDVLEYENLNFENAFISKENKTLNQLIKLNNVILTPHIAGWTKQSFEKISVIAATKMINYLHKKNNH